MTEYVTEHRTDDTVSSSTHDSLSVVSSDMSASDSASASVSVDTESESDSRGSVHADIAFRAPRPPSSSGGEFSSPMPCAANPSPLTTQSQCKEMHGSGINVLDPVSSPSLEAYNAALQLFRNQLPKQWTVVMDQCGFHLLLTSPKSPLAIKREIFISFAGNVLIYMHCVLVPSFVKLFNISADSAVVLNVSSAEKYCDFALNLVKVFMRYAVCVGANDMETRKVWYMVDGCCIDSNPYREESYEETCRSVSCLRIVELGLGIRCKECSRLIKNIRTRKKFLLSSSADPSTKNQNLTREQAMHKLNEQHEAIRKKDKSLAYFKLKGILDTEGVNIDEDLSEELSQIMLSSSKLSDNQKMFLIEQWSASNKSDSRSHRWHPSMIRFALHIYMTSSAGYKAFRDTGVLKLPSERTLFDYSHAIKAEQGINKGIVELVHGIVSKHKEAYKYFHVLLCDGIHISQNLVLRKEDGNLLGYTHMDDVDKEVDRFEKYLNGQEPMLCEPQLATEMLAYMVKGILCSDVKCVVAAYPCKVITKEIMYKWTWDVIRTMENASVKILAFVCDGYPVNRAVFEMHSPITTGTHFGVVFDTVNFCSPERRPLFFVSDVCHLLKTLRNGFYNSGEGPKKPRLLTVKGETIVWKTIVRLYLTFKGNNFRKSYKLNAQNVFPSSYSKMKVKYAGQILSATVGKDIEAQGWPGTDQTVQFILLCNKFFDTLNGAHSCQAGKTRNPDLAPYSPDNINDERFEWLKNEFLGYFIEWKKEVDAMPITRKEKEKLMLPQATLKGLEISIRGIEGATKYYLNPELGGGPFLMARTFSQDPLEQHFALQRMGGGGSRNPNAAQFLQKQVSTAIQRALGVRSRGANSAEQDKVSKISDEPLAKRRKVKEK